MSTDNLNFTGQVVLTGAASLAVNGVSHPLSTIQTCMQARPRSTIPWVTIQKQISFMGFNRQFNPPLHVPLLGLYRGFTAIYAVEAFSFATAYVTNDLFKTQFGPIGAIFAAAAVSTPFIGVGEGAMQNRQSNNLSYQDKELWRRSTRVSGLIVTMQREVFWNLGIFYVTPKVTAEIGRRFPESPAWASQIFAATATGALIGFVTTPIAGIKTVIQTSREDLSILQAVRKITGPSSSIRNLFAGGTSRVGYIGLSMCLMNLVYQQLPSHLPDGLRRHI